MNGIFITRMGKDDRELFTPVSCYDVSLPDTLLDNPCNLLQYNIPCLMTVGIIHILKIVDVDHATGEVSLVSFCPLVLFFEPSHKKPVIIQPGHVIRDRHLFKEIFLLFYDIEEPGIVQGHGGHTSDNLRDLELLLTKTLLLP